MIIIFISVGGTTGFCSSSILFKNKKDIRMIYIYIYVYVFYIYNLLSFILIDWYINIFIYIYEYEFIEFKLKCYLFFILSLRL